MDFWILTGFVTLAVAGLLALVMVRRRTGRHMARAAYDLEVYRQQLKDLDRDVARGVVEEGDAERLRVEISRRILAADAQADSGEAGPVQPERLSRAVALTVVIAVALGTAVAYLKLGAPGYGDFGLQRRMALAEEYAQNRPSQSAAEAALPPSPAVDAEPSYVELVAQLRKATAERQDDAQGQALLAQHEARLGNFQAAYLAKERYIALMKDAANSDDYTDLAELQVMAAGGYVSPEAEDNLRHALNLSPQNGRARYYVGLMMGQFGRPDRGYEIWADTLRRGPAGTPWIEAIQAQITEMAQMAGVNYRTITPGSGSANDTEAQPATSLPGPSASDIEAAQEMTPQDRRAMIEGMVAGLAERLASEGGSAEEWARLIDALGVLGRQVEARQIYDEARTHFDDTPEGLEMLNAAINRVENAR